MIERCDAEIAEALATHDYPAWLVCIWHFDWAIERQLILEGQCCK